MIRLIAIAVLIAVVYVLVKYDTREEIQKGVVVVIFGAFVIYTVTVVATELMR